MKSMTYFKTAMFSFVCAIIFALLANIIHVKPILILSSLSIVVSFMSVVFWICSLMLDKFKYSKNVIVTLIFGFFAFSLYAVNPQLLSVQTFSGFGQLDIISLLFVICSLISCISLIVLIGRIIFGGESKKGK